MCALPARKSSPRKDVGSGAADVERRRAYPYEEAPSPVARTAIVHFAIACCVLTLAVVFAVAIVAPL